MTAVADQPGPVPVAGVERVRLLAISVALVVLALVQDPGRIAPDSKYDLSADPVAFLAKAWHLWEPLGDSGQLQNQAYGYFLPMGPFYALGHVVGLPAWVVQRLWWAVILLTAFHGLYRLAGRLQLGSPPTRLIAALAYAVSPRMLTELGPVSIEAWPMATAPWVLLPLIAVAPGRHLQAATRSALAVALTGGVNAVATGAVLPLPLWWLLTRARSRERRDLLLAWLGAVAAAIAWWLIPLVLLGRYSPPFLDWIENAEATTSRASLASAFRGTTQWVAWLRLPDPFWPAGWAVVSSPAVALLSWLLIGLAVAGLLRRTVPHRVFLVGGLLGGLLLLTLGHVGPMSPSWAPTVQQFLDRAGAPLRNTHKFDLVLRLPLCLALAHALAAIRVPAVRGMPWTRRGLAFTAACAVLGVAAPGLAGQLPARGSFAAVPGYWQAAATWLADHDDGGRTLILPGSTFATSIWGDPHDEPMQALARTPWAVRSAVPLSSAGNIRVLNAVEQQLATGRGSPGLAEFLARAGITRLLVRADLARDFVVGATPRAVTVRAALLDSPGLAPVRRFGPTLGGDSTDRLAWDGGLDLAVPALEVWAVNHRTGPAQLYPVSSVLRVSGTPESLLPLADSGLLKDRPVLLVDDPEAAIPVAGQVSAAPWVLTDTPQRREASFARVRQIYGPVLARDEPYRSVRPQHDWLPFERPLVTALNDSVSRISTSSDATDTQTGWQAFDQNVETGWTSGAFATGQYLEVALPEPVTLPERVRLTFGAGGARVATLTVRTDRGFARSELPAELATGQAQVNVPAGSTRRIRFTVTSVWSGQDLGRVSLAEIELPGIRPRRPLLVPRPAADGAAGPGAAVVAAPDLISLTTDNEAADGCVFVADRSWCSPSLTLSSSDLGLDRFVDLPSGAGYRVTGTARPRAGAAADLLLTPAGVPVVTASSRWTLEPAARPQAVFDNDPGTTWMAAPSDAQPRLRFSWQGSRRISAIRWFVAPGTFASRPTRLTVAVGSTRQTMPVAADGWARFSPRSGTELAVTVVASLPVPSRNPEVGLDTNLPVGASEVIVSGLDDLRRGPPDDGPVLLSCGQGPSLVIGDRALPTTLTGTLGQVLRREPMAVRPCPQLVTLAAGVNRVRLDPNPLVLAQTLRLERATGSLRSGPAPPVTVPDQIDNRSPEHRTIGVPAAAGQQLLVVHENANPGWRATLAGRVLPPVRVDGWQQAWLVPAGGGTVDLRFTPGRTYRIGLGAGLAILAGLVLVAAGREFGSGRPGRRRTRPLLLPPGRPNPGYGLLALAAVLGIGGVWAVVPLVGSFWLARRRSIVLVWLATACCALAAVAAALSAGGDDTGVLATVGSGCALLVTAALAARMDLDADRNSLSQALTFSARWAGRRPPSGPASAPEVADESWLFPALISAPGSVPDGDPSEPITTADPGIARTGAGPGADRSGAAGRA